MIRELLLGAALVVVVAVASLVFFNTGFAGPASAPAAQGTPSNEATVEVTVNDQGGLSVGGVNLASLGVAPLDPIVLSYIRALRDAHVLVEDQAVNVDVQNTPTVMLEWNPENRRTAAGLAAKYGLLLTDQVQQRLEQWINTSKIDVTARFANETSQPADIALTTPLLVDIGQNGQLTIEHFPLAAAIDQNTLNTILLGGNQAVVCWNKGKLTTTVGGADLPTLTLNPEGVQVVNSALNLDQMLAVNVTELKEPILAARLGVDLALPGGAHDANASCPE
jgi:hypothetical protein